MPKRRPNCMVFQQAEVGLEISGLVADASAVDATVVSLLVPCWARLVLKSRRLASP